MVQPCDTTQVRSDLDFGVKVFTVHFYAIELKLYQKIPKVIFYVGINF